MSKNKQTESVEVVQPELSDHEKLALWWEKNKSLVVGAVALVVIVVIGYQVLGFVQKQRVESLQAAYQALSDEPADWQSFAEKYDGTSLAGVTWLRLADEAYAQDDFEKASTHYENATKSLQHPILLGRAKLGQAVSANLAGDIEVSTSLFEAILQDETISETTRGQAGYKLMLIAVTKNDKALADKTMEKLKSLTTGGIWSSQAERLLTRFS